MLHVNVIVRPLLVPVCCISYSTIWTQSIQSINFHWKHSALYSKRQSQKLKHRTRLSFVWIIWSTAFRSPYFSTHQEVCAFNCLYYFAVDIIFYSFPIIICIHHYFRSGLFECDKLIFASQTAFQVCTHDFSSLKRLQIYY